MTASNRRRVVVLGGGMAGMAAAWRLSDPAFADRIESVTVHQRGWRLGGKGASSRAAHGRIEEHGLHVWLGYYENAFRVLQQTYDELDRPTTDPSAVVRTWHDALKPSTEVGLEDRRSGTWRHWVGDFSTNGLEPGDGRATESLSPVALIRRGVALLRDFFESLTVNPALVGSAPSGAAWTALRGALGLALEVVSLGVGLASFVPDGRARRVIDDILRSAQASLHEVALDDPDVRQTWELVSIVVATIRGLVADGVAAAGIDGFRPLNRWDYREWIGRHGASQEAVDCTLVRGLYDLVFGYAEGDTTKPGFGAGLGVFLSGKTFFDYKGAIFWKMQAGMGDIVFAPMYEAMRRRGVSFEFFSNLEHVGLSSDARSVERLVLGRQAQLRSGNERYEPLIRVGDLPVFPDAPLVEQLEACPSGSHGESWWARSAIVDRRELRAGADFDDVVFAIPVGMARRVTGELAAASEPWRAMLDGLGLVSTQALQIWLRSSEQSLGWHRPGVTISGYVKPFDTWASMPQLLAVEQWPDDDLPRSVEYFCATLPTDVDPPDDPAYPVARHDEVYENSVRFLDRDVGHYLPGATTAEGFDWDLLVGAEADVGPDRLRGQFWKANVDPSDLYVQSLPGTDALRLRADQSGFERLHLAGDWTDNGVNAGCIEAATLSGLQAANAVLGLPLESGTVGRYLPLNDRD